MTRAALKGGAIPVMGGKFPYNASHQMHLSSVHILDVVNRTLRVEIGDQEERHVNPVVVCAQYIEHT